jgi:hypothetical protein
MPAPILIVDERKSGPGHFPKSCAMALGGLFCRGLTAVTKRAGETLAIARLYSPVHPSTAVAFLDCVFCS